MISKKIADIANNLLPKQIENGLHYAGQYTVNIVKEVTPVATSTLRDSMGYKVKGDKARVGTVVEYAPFVEAKKGFFMGAVDNDLKGIQQAFLKGAKL